MKGSRAKKAAEAAAAAEAEAAAAGGLQPTPPAGAREGGPRPGPIVQASGETVQIPADVFAKLCGQLRTSELLGAAAADALEAAAGLRPVASPQCKAAQDLRTDVAQSRDTSKERVKSPEVELAEAMAAASVKMEKLAEQVKEKRQEVEADESRRASKETDGENSSGPKKKKAMNFSAAPVDEIPDLPEAEVFSDPEADDQPKEDKPEPPTLNLTPKQNHMRTDLEMWVMDEIPALFGVDDSEELAEDLQEDGQADKLTFLIAETDETAQAQMLDEWVKDAPDPDAKSSFANDLLEKVRAIQALSPKKKKKKKKKEVTEAEAES